MKYLLLVLAVLTAISCTKKIDGSSEEAFKKSISELKSSLKGERVNDFDEALLLITFDNLKLGNISEKGAIASGELHTRLDVYTIDGIFELAGKIRIKNEEKKREEARKEILELKDKEKKDNLDRESLMKFKVVKSRFYKRKSGWGSEEPIIELAVKNETEHAISRAYFEGEITSKGRAIPWLKDDFNYEIPGGLEPGEEAVWKLSPNLFSDWGTVESPKDAIFLVEVKKLDGPDKEMLYSVDNFSDDDKERLAELLKTYPEFK